MFSIFENIRKAIIELGKIISEKHYLQVIIYSIILILVHLYKFNVLFNPMVEDEIGYWASAAWINGINWNDLMSQRAYMGWGYGVLLSPLFFIGNSKYMFYGAICINMFFVLGIYFNLIFINRRICGKRTENEIQFISFIVCLYSYLIVFSHMTMCEICLTFFFSLVFLLIQKFLERPSCKLILLICIVNSILVSIHLRELVIIIATSICFIVYLVTSKDEKKVLHTIVYFMLTIVLTFFVFKIKEIFIDAVYVSNVLEGSYLEVPIQYNNNNDNFMIYIQRIRHYLQPENIFSFIKSIVAKLLYLLESSIYVMGFSIYSLVIYIKYNLKEKRYYRGIQYYFLMLTFIGNLILLALTMGNSGRLDAVMYGRYIENIIPVYLMIGFGFIIEHKEKILNIGLKIIVCAALFCISTYDYIMEGNLNMDVKSILHYQVSGISGLPYVKVISSDIYFTWYVFLVVCLLFLLFIWISKKNLYLALLFIGVCWTINSYSVLDNFIYNHPETIAKSEQTRIDRFESIYEIANIINVLGPEKLYYVYEESTYTDSSYDIGTLQFDLYEKPILFLEESNIKCVNSSDLLIVHKRNTKYEQYKKMFNLVEEGYSFGLFNIKGK